MVVVSPNEEEKKYDPPPPPNIVDDIVQQSSEEDNSSEDDGSDAIDGVTDGKSVTVSSKASSSNDTKHKKKSAAKHSVDVFCSMSKDDIANATSFKHCHGSGKKSWKCHKGNIKRHGVFV